ncbi:MAG: DsrE family protein [Burkholderiaceae bacterium]|nr:DsrE family protein [Burkholderiaceae bacterium]
MSGYVEHAADGVALLLWAADPERPDTLATPFFHAAAAAALELPVELYFSARSVHLLLPGVADGLPASRFVARSVGDAMREAHAQGARFYVCSDALQAQGLQGRALIPECAGHGGALQFMVRAADLRWRTLVF